MKLTAKELIRLQKETHLLEHGFYDKEINNSISEWAEDTASDEYNWLRNELKNHIFPWPPYSKEYFEIALSTLSERDSFDKTESRKYKLASYPEVRIFWFKTKFPEFFKDED